MGGNAQMDIFTAKQDIFCAFLRIYFCWVKNIIPIVLIKHIFVILNIANEKSLLRLVFKRKMLIGK